jgi:predicted RNA-binding protein
MPQNGPISVIAFTITDEKIVAIDVVDDPGRIAEVDLAILGR